MHTLLAALKLPIRRYALAGAALAAALAAGGVWFAMRPVAAPSCDDAGDELEALIPRDLPDKLRAIGATIVSSSLDRARKNVSDASPASAAASCGHPGPVTVLLGRALPRHSAPLRTR